MGFLLLPFFLVRFGLLSLLGHGAVKRAAYFVFFLGCALLTQSPLLLAVILVFQITAHWIILSEERWCVQTFGDEYRQYMKKVRRYL